MLAQAILLASLHCTYSFMGNEMSQVTLGFNPDGSPQDYVTVSMQGKSHTESATPDTVTDDQLAHVWISKENSDGGIEMIVYKVPKSKGQSKLVNHAVPIGKEMWGPCTFQGL